MPVEDVFTITGRGTVATGRVERGIIKMNEEVEIVGLSDEKKKTVVTGIEIASWGKDLKNGKTLIDALEAVAPQHDVDIVDVELVGATKAPCVRVRIEGAEGQSLSLNDVTANTKWVGDVIEELDPISSSYTLEVSSPGMARPLRRPSDFARFVGENCELTSTATEGRRKYTGKIAAATETNVTLELEDGESVTLDFSDVKKCKLKPTYDFKPAKEGK